ncbi:uncharacterized protein LOC132197481 isoform X2 [Neocloeon triangulifer]|uniref:uncharacterized protein LOC132197481 isoform X2 n=1 Tax=Neocloeon triangulifer TaxID=2078957 RepID=UPI00286EC3CC|nr:uncharacterized protein LOC132197481 isoform X2 [Neocloeon triangulifer]
MAIASFQTSVSQTKRNSCVSCLPAVKKLVKNAEIYKFVDILGSNNFCVLNFILGHRSGRSAKCRGWSCKIGTRRSARLSKIVNRRTIIIKCCGLKKCSASSAAASIDKHHSQQTHKQENFTESRSSSRANYHSTETKMTDSEATTDSTGTLVGPETSASASALIDFSDSSIQSTAVTYSTSEATASFVATNSTTSTTTEQIATFSTTTASTSTTATAPTATSTASSSNEISTTPETSKTISPALVGKCNPDTNAVTNRSLFSTNGLLTNPDLHGFWLDACGLTLLLGKSLGTWNENSAKCFGLNMQPFTLESKDKLDCMNLQAKDWKFNMNYWTGGTKDVASGAFGWCSANGSAPWQDFLPLANLASDHNCVQMHISKANASVSVNDRRCSDRFIFACQGPPTAAPSFPQCQTPICTKFACQKDPNLFTSTDNGKTMTLNNFTLHGRLFSQKLRSYLFSHKNDSRTYLEAAKACCALGMSLLSLDGNHKYDALANIANTDDMNSEAQNLTMWTSGSDEGCESVFGFCSAKRMFRDEAKWLPGQPDNAGGNENYVAVHIWRQRGQVLLADYDGQTKFRYICEKRLNPQSKSGKQAITDECSLIYNITSAEIDLLQNATNLDLRMKCFVQCVGDAVDLLVGGKFVESKVFAILESMAMLNVDGLINNMAIVDECNNKTYGMDLCDKAYQLAKCARDKSPAVFDQIIKDLDNQTTENDLLIPKGYGCAYSANQTCTVNVALRDNIAALNLNASTCVDFVNQSWVCKCSDLKQYYISFRNSMYFPYIDAVKFCCERGLQMLSPQNFVNAVNCLRVQIPHPYASYLYTLLNAAAVDLTTGFSFDCESQTSFSPQQLGFVLNYNASGAFGSGPVIAFGTHNQGTPMIRFVQPNAVNSFICGEI